MGKYRQEIPGEATGCATMQVTRKGILGARKIPPGSHYTVSVLCVLGNPCGATDTLSESYLMKAASRCAPYN